MMEAGGQGWRREPPPREHDSGLVPASVAGARVPDLLNDSTASTWLAASRIAQICHAGDWLAGPVGQAPPWLRGGGGPRCSGGGGGAPGLESHLVAESHH